MTDTAPPSLKEIIETYDLGAKKALGQHFLLDLNITRKIARLADVGPDDTVLEVGPGPGGLTRALLEAGSSVIAVERDARCLPALEDQGTYFPGQLTLIEGDALKIDEAEICRGEPIKIISNLPYNISTELLIKWLRLDPQFWTGMALMFQKEVADRILAAPGSKTYGRLSVIAQAASRPQRGFDLPARAFTPPPKVASSVVLFYPAGNPLTFLSRLETITQGAFSQRRKMVRSSLKGVFGPKLETALNHAGIEATQRAEDISVDQYIALSKYS